MNDLTYESSTFLIFFKKIKFTWFFCGWAQSGQVFDSFGQLVPVIIQQS